MTKPKLKISLVLAAHAITLFASVSSADEIEALFIRGNEYYQQGDYEAAIQSYEKIFELGYESWEVHYNLGNAYYKKREIARAILNYERAKRVNPKNEDVNFNLELANLSVVDRIPEIPRVFFAAWIYDFANLISLPMLGVLTGVMYVALVTLLVYRILRRSKAFRRGNLTAIIISGVLLVVFASLLALRIYENENKLEAIVLIPKVDIRNEPNNTATEMFTLHEGVKVEVKDQQGRWVKIRLADGKVGWVKNEKIEII